ncbi:MAG: helix-turn-helix domain-containing protein [Ramlibacter sp.]|nr:helix-turn-helix domain-containing protein [Ramlibacter sp.]
MNAQENVTAAPDCPDERLPANHANPACLQNVINAVAVLNGRWAPAVLATLYVMEVPCRFGELQRRITGISQKELARHLANLARQGVIRREVVARTVQYSLTADGLRLLGRMKSLGEWNRDRAAVTGRAHDRARAASWIDPLIR